MTDDQIKKTFGLEESRQMLEYRELIKAQVTPEVYEDSMIGYKAQIQALLDMVPGSGPLDAAYVILDELNTDTNLNEEQLEMLKAIYVIAAFEMQEF